MKDANKNRLLYEMEDQITRKSFYVVVNLTDEVMVIGQSEMPDARYRSIVRKCYLRNLGFNFPVGMFRYRRGGIKADWVDIFQITQGASTSSTNFIKTIATASREAPSNFSKKHTSDAIDSMKSKVGSNSILATALLSTLLTYGTSYVFC